MTKSNHSRHTVVATYNVAGGWFNPDPGKFALVPNGDDSIDEELGHLVDGLVERHATIRERNGGCSKALTELLDLHVNGLILWPLAFLWHQSALGEMSEGRFCRIAAESSEEIGALQSAIKELEAFKLSTPDSTKSIRDRSFAYWKIAASIALASSNVRSIDDLQPEHFGYLAAIFRPNGEWADWASRWTQKTLRWFSNVLAVHREDIVFDKQFAANPLRPARRGPRTANLLDINPHLAWIDQHYEQFLDERKYLRKKPARAGKRLLMDFFSQLPAEEGSSPQSAFGRGTIPSLVKFTKIWSTSPPTRTQALSKVREFANWLIDNSRDEHGHATLEIAINDRDIAAVNDDVELSFPSGSSDVAARPMPTRYHLALKKIIAEENFAWPKSLRNESTKRPLHWFQWQNPNGSVELIFCEVLPRMLLLHLDLPLRNIQVRRLDSGEGDRTRWDPERKSWIPNGGPNAGYWEKAGAKNPRRGVFREIRGREGSIAGFWINSNKTADAKTRFDEHSGYPIPWQHDDVLGNLTGMRIWQEKYNPVDGPLPFAALPKGIFEDEPSKSVKAQIPARFYLFRYPQNGGKRGPEAPPTYKVFLQFFYDALDELERRLNAEDPENPVAIITKRDPGGAPKQAIFTLHGMRSSTLTALYEEGVSIEILSKLVAGHASILMTLKYLKFEPAHVSQILTEARMKALTTARSEFPNFLRNATFEQAARMTARLSDDGLHQAFGNFSNSGALARMDGGICPNGATLCGIGGKVIQKRTTNTGRDKSTYSPVPGGPRNCVRCRFFLTGLPFLIPLASQAHVLSEKADRLARRIASGEPEIDALKQQRRKLSSEGLPVPPELRERIIMKEEAWLADIESRDQVLADFHATVLFVEKLRAIRAEEVANGSTENLLMVLAGEEFPELIGRESTRFEVVDAVVQASRWFPSINGEELEHERNAAIDKILHWNNYTPITLAPLTADERRHAADAMAAFFLIELGAFETQALIEGRKTLAEVGLERPLKEVYQRLIGRPLERSSLRRLSHAAPR